MFPIRLFSSHGRRAEDDRRSAEAAYVAAAATASHLASLAESARRKGAPAEAAIATLVGAAAIASDMAYLADSAVTKGSPRKEGDGGGVCDCQRHGIVLSESARIRGAALTETEAWAARVSASAAAAAVAACRMASYALTEVASANAAFAAAHASMLCSALLRAQAE